MSLIAHSSRLPLVHSRRRQLPMFVSSSAMALRCLSFVVLGVVLQHRGYAMLFSKCSVEELVAFRAGRPCIDTHTSRQPTVAQLLPASGQVWSVPSRLRPSPGDASRTSGGIEFNLAELGPGLARLGRDVVEFGPRFGLRVLISTDSGWVWADVVKFGAQADNFEPPRDGRRNEVYSGTLAEELFAECPCDIGMKWSKVFVQTRGRRSVADRLAPALDTPRVVERS